MVQNVGIGREAALPPCRYLHTLCTAAGAVVAQQNRKRPCTTTQGASQKCTVLFIRDTGQTNLLKPITLTKFSLTIHLYYYGKNNRQFRFNSDPASITGPQFKHFENKSNSSRQKCGDLGATLPKFGPLISRPG